MSKIYKQHGYTKGKVSSTYIRWYAMVDRCHNKKNSSYKYYGGRGITVCKKWRESITNFVKDMGECPKGQTLDRIDNNGNYSKSNCRWATRKEQRANQRPYKNTTFLTFNGQRLSLKDWSIKLNIKYITLYNRIHLYKMKPNEALNKLKI